MGRKRAKKGKGAEKTALKTEKKATKRIRSALESRGEEDVEKMVVGYQLRNSKRPKLIENKCPPPSARSNASLTSHPDKDELIMFGGEYYNGSKSVVYDNLYIYHIKTNEWSEIVAPNSPPPRCSHQAVSVRQAGGQLWIFGGEFASPSESQFYHYRDLWVFNLKDKTWENVNVPGGPSARSGHRMVACKKHLIVFGGFHDNLRDYKYFNDLYAFSMENYVWCQLTVSGIGPSPRSGCMMSVTQDQQQLVIVGGYSKERVKKDVDKGTTHSDMFMLTPDSKCKEEAFASKWKWSSVRQSGVRPTSRCGTTLVATAGNKALLFGGVEDEVEDEESVQGKFYNDLYCLELDKGRWHQLLLRGKAGSKTRRSRRQKAKADKVDDAAGDDEDSDEELGDDIDELSLGEMTTKTPESRVISQQTTDDGFTVTVKSSGVEGAESNVEGGEATNEVPMPSPRMKALLVVHKSVVYLYGGIYELADRQFTLGDMHCLNLHRLDCWQTLHTDSPADQEWVEEPDSEDSGSDSGEESGGSDDEEEDDDEDEDEEEEAENEVNDSAAATTGDNKKRVEAMDTVTTPSSSDGDCFRGAPALWPQESEELYRRRTEAFWQQRAREVAEGEGLRVTDKQVTKAARRMVTEFFALNQ